MEQRPQDSTATGQAQPTNLWQQVALVHCLRQAHAAAKDHLDRLRREWEETNAVWIEQVRLCAAGMVQAENELRAAALDEYRKSGVKKICPGVGIRETSVLYYDPDQAEAWARKHDMFLRLDAKSFEKFATNNPAQVGDLVIIERQPQCILATDLGKALFEGELLGPAREGE